MVMPDSMCKTDTKFPACLDLSGMCKMYCHGSVGFGQSVAADARVSTSQFDSRDAPYVYALL